MLRAYLLPLAAAFAVTTGADAAVIGKADPGVGSLVEQAHHSRSRGWDKCEYGWNGRDQQYHAHTDRGGRGYYCGPDTRSRAPRYRDYYQERPVRCWINRYGDRVCR